MVEDLVDDHARLQRERVRRAKRRRVRTQPATRAHRLPRAWSGRDFHRIDELRWRTQKETRIIQRTESERRFAQRQIRACRKRGRGECVRRSRVAVHERPSGERQRARAVIVEFALPDGIRRAADFVKRDRRKRGIPRRASREILRARRAVQREAPRPVRGLTAALRIDLRQRETGAIRGDRPLSGVAVAELIHQPPPRQIRRVAPEVRRTAAAARRRHEYLKAAPVHLAAGRIRETVDAPGAGRDDSVHEQRTARGHGLVGVVQRRAIAVHVHLDANTANCAPVKIHAVSLPGRDARQLPRDARTRVSRREKKVVRIQRVAARCAHRVVESAHHPRHIETDRRRRARTVLQIGERGIRRSARRRREPSVGGDEKRVPHIAKSRDRLCAAECRRRWLSARGIHAIALDIHAPQLIRRWRWRRHRTRPQRAVVVPQFERLAVVRERADKRPLRTGKSRRRLQRHGVLRHHHVAARRNHRPLRKLIRNAAIEPPTREVHIHPELVVNLHILQREIRRIVVHLIHHHDAVARRNRTRGP